MTPLDIGYQVTWKKLSDTICVPVVNLGKSFRDAFSHQVLHIQMS